MIQPSKAQIDAGVAAGRKAIDDYSSFDSSLISDDVLLTFVTAVITAVVNVKPKAEMLNVPLKEDKYDH